MSAPPLDQRVLAAIVAHFNAVGYSPSHPDIARAVPDVAPRHVGRHLRRLAAREVLTFTAGKPRSIVLADRVGNLSSDELERAVRARGGRVTWSVLPALAEAFGGGGANRGMATPPDMADLIAELD